MEKVYQITFDDLIVRDECKKLSEKNSNSSRIIKEIDINKLSEMFDIDLDI